MPVGVRIEMFCRSQNIPFIPVLYSCMIVKYRALSNGLFAEITKHLIEILNILQKAISYPHYRQ